MYDFDDNIKSSLMGRIVEDRRDGLRLYKSHSRAVGFSVRLSIVRRNKNDGVITDFYFCCSKEGFLDTKRQKKEKKYHLLK